MFSRENLIILEEIGSTQDVAYDMAKRWAPHGVAVMALNQTSGRGRMGRSWSSPTGKNLALSTILRPSCKPAEAPLYGLAASVAAAMTVEAFCSQIKAQVKWPNDVIVDGRKIAGILPQALIGNSKTEFVVIGLGLNVNSGLSDLPGEIREKTTSMLSLSSRSFDLVEVALSFLGFMNELHDNAESFGFRNILDMWNARWAHRGLFVERPEVRGIAEGIDDTGALLVRTLDHGLVSVSGGEAHFHALPEKQDH